MEVGTAKENPVGERNRQSDQGVIALVYPLV